MAKELFRRTEKLLTKDRMGQIFHKAGTDDVPYSATDHKINKVGTKANTQELINFRVKGLEREGETTWHSRKISFQTSEYLKNIGIPEGTTRE